MPKALVAEDDALLALTIVDVLKVEHYTVEHVPDGEEALFRLKSYNYDLIVLDWEMPKMTGVEVCKAFRQQGGSTPVLILTGKGAEMDKVAGLDAGADDYLVKPFSVPELCARLRALLRRSGDSASKTNLLQAGEISLDTKTCEVKVQGKTVSLLPKELAILEFLLRHPNQFFSSKALIERVWSSESEVGEETLRSNISRLRSKLDGAKSQNDKGARSCIETERGLGYRLVP